MRDIAELKLTRVGPPVTEAAIRQFEQLIGVQLPADYVSFLLQANGGYPAVYLFRPLGAPEEDARVVNTFFRVSFDPTDVDGLMFVCRDTAAWRMFLPDGVVPIADDPGGDLICLDMRVDAEAQVVWWDHEDPEKLQPVARTFAEWVDGLYMDPDLE